jgi:hypothetical protein
MSRGMRVYWKEASLLYEDDGFATAAGAPPTVMAVHPHGVFCMGWGALFAQAPLRDFHFCFAHVLYSSPFFKAFTSLIGRPASASKASFLKLMAEGE